MRNVLDANTVSVFALATRAVAEGHAETASGWLANEVSKVLAKLEVNNTYAQHLHGMWTIKVHDLGSVDRYALLAELVELKWGARYETEQLLRDEAMDEPEKSGDWEHEDLEEIRELLDETFSAADLTADIASELSTRSVEEIVEDWLERTIEDAAKQIGVVLAA